MKILIAGGAGFIASHIADEYVKAGHNVVIIDDLSKGFRKNINKKAKFYKADIRDTKAMMKIFQKEKPTVVNHHAADASVVGSMNDPLKTYNVNVLGTINVLLAFGSYKTKEKKRFIFASTGGAIYREPGEKHLPVDETMEKAPVSPYGLSKQLGEDVIHFYAKQFGFETVIFRYANVFGPRQNPKGEAGVCAIFTRLIKEGGQPVIFGDGTKSRDYVFVGDVAKANFLALNCGAGETMNIGTGKLTSDDEMFETIAAAMKFKGKAVHAPARPGEIYKMSLKYGRAKKALGWEPKVNFKEGIKKIVETL